MPLHSLVPAQRLLGCAAKCVRALIQLKDYSAENKRKTDERTGSVSTGSVSGAVHSVTM